MNKLFNNKQYLKVILIFFLASININIYAQNIAITGTVIGETGETLPGVSVTIKGTSVGTMTLSDGTYGIEVPEGNNILVFSYIGMETQEKTVIGTVINISMKLLSEDIEEVVVVGYGYQKKSDLTGSLSSVSGEDIAKTQSQSLSSVLQGRIAGIDVISNSGSPGRDAEINIRGVSSINGASPLWVVDGVPTSGDINSLDIESVEILKDASATSIYGTRGAGGVILITTKKGKKGKMSVNYSNKFSLGKMYKKLDLLTAPEWAKIRGEAYQNALLPVPEELQNYTGDIGTDWQKEVTGTAFSNNQYLNFSGADEKYSYSMSLSRNKNEGIILKSDETTTAFRINTSAKITDWLKVGENFSFSKSTTHLINEDDEWNAILIQAIAIDPITAVRHEDGTWDGTSYNTIDNPVAHIDRTKDESKDYSVGGNFYAEISFLKNFNFTTRYGYQQDYGNFYGFTPTFFVQTGEENAQTSVSRDFFESINWVSSNYLTWQQKFNIHDLKIMAGYEVEDNSTEWFGTSVIDLISESSHLIYIDNATGNQSASSYGLANEVKYISYFSRFNYNLLNRYLVTLNFRRQGSSKFGINNRYGNFPSASVAWKIHKEKFMNTDKINLMKLRLGYGITGNDLPILPYSFYSTSASGKRYVVGNVIVDGVSFPQIPNPELHWEQKKSSNIGLDMAFFGNKITLNTDFYIEQTEEMLYDPELPGHIGTEEMPVTNAASLKNTGFDIELGYKHINKDFKYNINFTFSHVKNIVSSLGSADAISDAPFMQLGLISRTESGHPMASFYGYVTNGLFQNQAEVDAYTKPNGDLIQPNAFPGDIKYIADEDGNLVLDFIGNPFPDFTAGLNFDMSYNNFELLIFLYGVYGNEIFNATRFFTQNSSVRYNMDASIKNRWMMEGDTDDPNLARVNLQDANNSLRSDRFIEDGSYLRVKNIQLAYTLNNKLIKVKDFNTLKIFVGVENLYTLTKYSGFDPEVGIGWYGALDRGIDRARYPNPRTIYFGLNLKF